MRSMLVFKMGCQQWLEDYGGDTSGYVYKSVKDYYIGAPHDASVRFSSQAQVFLLPSQEGKQSPAGAAQEFCIRSAKLCGKGVKAHAADDFLFSTLGFMGQITYR